MRIRGSVVDLKVMDDISMIKANESSDVKNFIFLKGRILTCDEPNSNGDYFPAEEVKKSYRTFIGKVVDFNHNENIVLGKIIDAEWIEKSPKDEKSAVDIICKINKNAYVDIVKQIESGILRQMSLEAYADRALCSICGWEFNFIDIEPCEHIKGGLMREIEGDDGNMHLIFKKDYDLTFVGAGIVPNPADKKADIEHLLASAMKENQYRMKKAKDKAKDGKVEEAKKQVEPLVACTSLEQSLKNTNALDFLNILKSINNKWNGTTKKIAQELADKIDVVTTKELAELLSKNYDKLTTTDIDEIKAELKKQGKYIDSTYNAVFVEDTNSSFWLISKNGIPILRATLEKIWGEELEKDIQIDGLHIKEYAKSDYFRKNLLKALTVNGENYVKDIWDLKNLLNEEPPLEEIIGKLIGFDLKDTQRILCNFNNVKEMAKKDIKEIKNPIVVNTMEKFEACVLANKENKEIVAQKGQTQGEAVEAHCFKTTVVGIKASQHDVFDKLSKSIKEPALDLKAWMDYKISGKWPKSPSERVLIKQFALKIIQKMKSNLTFEEQKVLEGSAKYMKEIGFSSEFISKYSLIASESDIKHLVSMGLGVADINELYSTRFL